METATTRAAGTVDYVGSATADSKASPVEDSDLFNKILDGVYEKYPKSALYREIDQLSATLSLVIPEQESAETPATAADKSFILRAESMPDVTVTLHLDSDLAQLQNDAVAISSVWSNHIHSFSSDSKTVMWKQPRKRKRIR